jgi:hypothetical protein
MALFIQIKDGQPVDHPVYDFNLVQVYGQIPTNYVAFNRVQQPAELLTSPFQTAQSSYALSSDGVTWEDVWTAVEMSADEKSALIASTQANPPGPNVTLDTTTLTWNPNTSKPSDGQKYYWDWAQGIWVQQQG